MNVKKQVGVLSMALVVASLMGIKSIGAAEITGENGEKSKFMKGMFVTEQPNVNNLLLSAKTDGGGETDNKDKVESRGLLDDTLGETTGAQFITNSHDDMIINMYSEIKSKEKEVEDFKKNYESIKWVQEYGIEPTSLSLDRINLLNTGKKYIGIPYVWGGTTPSGFDCSGYTSYVMREVFGENIGRTTSDQPYSSHLQRIPLSEAQPGDLIYKVGQHTGFFIKDNGSSLLIMHSPTQGQKLKIGKYDRNVRVYRPKSVDDSKKLTVPDSLKEEQAKQDAPQEEK
ncbi:hypothetical protein UT300012_24120 [Paraclostridium bifermentans]